MARRKLALKEEITVSGLGKRLDSQEAEDGGIPQDSTRAGHGRPQFVYGVPSNGRRSLQPSRFSGFAAD